MQTLPFPSGAYLAVELGNFLLTVLCLRHAWRQGRELLVMMLAGVLFGYIVEYSQVTKPDAPYFYTEALITLPGPVPLGIVLSWGIIFFATFQTVTWLGLKGLRKAIAGGLLAVGIDFVIDPAFVFLKFWIWKQPGPWFGIPWVNFVGWFVIAAAFLGFNDWLFRKFPPQGRPFWQVLLTGLAAVPLAFALFVGVMLCYLGILAYQLPQLPESRLAGLILGLALIYVLLDLPKLSRDRAPDAIVLAVPGYLLGCGLLILAFSGLSIDEQPLVIVIPVFVTAVMMGYCWPSLERLWPGGRLRGGTLAAGGPAGLFGFLRCWAPWLLVIVTVGYFTLVPNRGLIGPVQLPQQDAFLPEENVQWWYWTGHLLGTDEQGEQRRFGFEVVFFAFDGPFILHDQLVQVAITDIDRNQFHFKEYIEAFKLPTLVPDGFKLTAGKSGGAVQASGGNGSDRIHSEVDGYVLDLNLNSRQTPVLRYGAGPHPYYFGGFTYYYSRQSMDAQGELTVAGKKYRITGTAWFDRQYGELYQAIIRGWQWFAVDLDDGRHVMLFDFLGKGAERERFGSITAADGTTRDLGPQDFAVKVLGEWKSPNTGCTYPSGWEITLGDLTFEVQPYVKDQELRATHGYWAGPEYWEGASGVSGGATGKAYVELNGFCRNVEGTFKP